MYEMEGALPGCVSLGRRLPGKPGAARRPPVPSTRLKCRFPDPPDVPESPPDGSRFQR